MFSKSYKLKISSLSKLKLLSIIFVLIGSAISTFGLYQLFNVSTQETSPDSYATTQVCEKDPEFGGITVDIGGAVVFPGVYVLEPGRRVSDLVTLAGGFSRNADKEFTNKVLNLAAKLTDSEKIYIPTLADSIEEMKTTNIQDDIINTIAINSASKTQLQTLSGIGEKRAEDITVSRPFASISELVEKGVISENLFESIKNEISL